MISSETLRLVARGGSGPVLIDNSGQPYQIDGLPDDASVPSLVVGKVTEAVKQVETGTVVKYLNRDALWAVEGFLLDRDVVDSLPDDVDSPERLIDAVREAGFEWHAVIPMASEPRSD
ncbi:MAG TPA: hypothetical protein VGC03_01275 [Acidimicrobiia bacterium]|jgi:hypothetical protein